MALSYQPRRWISKKGLTPDYTNQLDLFSEAAVETTVPVALEPSRKLSHARPRAPEQLGLALLEPLSPLDAGTIPATEPAPGGGGAVRQADGRGAVGTEDRPQPDQGNRDTDSSPASRVVLDIEPVARPSRDFRITESHRIGQGGLHEKARDNIAAIRLLKILGSAAGPTVSRKLNLAICMPSSRMEA